MFNLDPLFIFALLYVPIGIMTVSLYFGGAKSLKNKAIQLIQKIKKYRPLIRAVEVEEC